ncbi:MAG TPA: UBP-type zinc finger domain-containing protein [Gemmatimonadaceae bacterium]|jgi:uncharacterized UBP type Zn finger protein|nr:UBP-type zinc finger domain-containing protein [Gemmatimonadaceae bacterium]
MSAAKCTHLDLVHDVSPNTPGCEECLKTGGWWVHLRLCLTCGHVGCCDQSPGRHATRHAGETKHFLIRSLEPDEDWGYCYADELFMEPAPTPSSKNSAGAR